MSGRREQVVVLGMLTKMPVAGVVWQTVHYLLGLRRLGFEPYYVETHGRTPSMLMASRHDDGSLRAAEFIARMMRRFDLGERWAYRARGGRRRAFGMSARQLGRLYRDAALLINLHGGTRPTPELARSGRLVYVETDPVQAQVELHDGVAATFEFLDQHCAHFTFAENLGRAGCGLPVCDRYAYHPTRQPVVVELWERRSRELGAAFTTVGNWRQDWRTVRYGGRTLTWSKDREFARFLDLPARTGQAFELALSSYGDDHRRMLEDKGWTVRSGLDLSSDIETYRAYVASSRGEFTAAKEQNVRLRSGWFSDRSATYLAAGRPVVTQDTGFGAALPTGAGLFAVADLEQAVASIERIESDYERQRAAAVEIAREHFAAERVLGSLVDVLGLRARPRWRPPARAAA